MSPERSPFEVDVEGRIESDPGALRDVTLWVLARYRESLAHRSGAGSALLMGFLAALGESVRIREVVGPLPQTEVTYGRPERIEVSVTTAARLLGCSPRWVRQLASVGKLPARRLGKVWLIDATNLMED